MRLQNPTGAKCLRIIRPELDEVRDVLLLVKRRDITLLMPTVRLHAGDSLARPARWAGYKKSCSAIVTSRCIALLLAMGPSLQSFLWVLSTS